MCIIRTNYHGFLHILSLLRSLPFMNLVYKINLFVLNNGNSNIIYISSTYIYIQPVDIKCHIKTALLGPNTGMNGLFLHIFNICALLCM